MPLAKGSFHPKTPWVPWAASLRLQRYNVNLRPVLVSRVNHSGSGCTRRPTSPWWEPFLTPTDSFGTSLPSRPAGTPWPTLCSQAATPTLTFPTIMLGNSGRVETSHWSRSIDTPCSDHDVATQLKAPKAPFQGNLLSFAESLWLPWKERKGSTHAIGAGVRNTLVTTII